MTFGEYQIKAMRTVVYPKDIALLYTALKLNGEAGEVAERVGKLYRDMEGRVDNVFRDDILNELGDVLWYISALASELGISLESIAIRNLDKLASRHQRGKMHGSGDHR